MKKIGLKYFFTIAGTLWICCCASLQVFAQHPDKIYKTYGGNIGFIGVYNDSVVIASSSNLVVTLDYESGIIKFKLDFNTLQTEQDTFYRFFHSQIPLILEFNGKLGIDYVLTESHPPLEFNVIGKMILNGIEKRKMLKGTLIHYPTEHGISERLSMKFDLNLEDFQLMERFAGFHEVMKVEIAQAVLDKE